MIYKYISGTNSWTSSFVNRGRRKITGVTVPCRRNGQQNYTTLNMKEMDALGDQKQDSSARYWMTSLRKKIS
jgi:hypothetical protein